MHITGKIDDLAGYIETITLRPRMPERAALSIRCCGGAAVIKFDPKLTHPDTVWMYAALPWAAGSLSARHQRAQEGTSPWS